MDPIDETEVQRRIELITRGLQEVTGLEQLKEIVAKRPLKIYWGTASTGKIHGGYLVALMKLADFLEAECEVTILLADLHAYLDNMKSSLDLVAYRTNYYEHMITAILVQMGVNVDKLRFVRGMDFQLNKRYTFDVYRLMSIQSLNDARRAGSEVVKQSDNPMMSGLLYPGLQMLDEEYLDCDATLGGLDQRKIFMAAEEYLPRLGYKKRIHLMNTMLVAINAQPPKDIKDGLDDKMPDKMSSSDLNSKIDMLDSPGDVSKKIKRAYCLPGDLTFNPLMDLMRLVIFPLLQLKASAFIINRPEKFGGNVEFDNYEQLKEAFVNQTLHPADLKQGVTDFLNDFTDPIRRIFETDDMKKLIKLAYPI